MRHNQKYQQTGSLVRFWKYLFGKMSKQDQHAFEKRLLNDPFEAEALDGLSQLSEEDFAEDMQLLHSKIQSSGQRKSSFLRTWMVAATIIVVIGIIGILTLLSPPDNQRLSQNLPSKDIKEEPHTEVAEEKNLSATPGTQITEKESKKKNETGISPVKKQVGETIPIQRAKQVSSEPTQTGQKGSTLKPLPAKRTSVELIDADSAPVEAIIEAEEEPVVKQKKRALTGVLRGHEITETTAAYDEEVVVIKGIVTDEKQDPIQGANVFVKGTNKATYSNADGSYRIAVQQQDSAKPIMAGFVGYVSKEQPQNDDSVNFSLEPEILTADELDDNMYDSERELKIITENYVPAQPLPDMETYIAKIEDSLQTPEDGSGKRETIVLWLTISEKGLITDVEIKRSPGDAYSFEAIDKLRNGQAWLPATRSGIPVEDKVKIKLKFKP